MTKGVWVVITKMNNTARDHLNKEGRLVKEVKGKYLVDLITDGYVLALNVKMTENV